MSTRKARWIEILTGREQLVRRVNFQTFLNRRILTESKSAKVRLITANGTMHIKSIRAPFQNACFAMRYELRSKSPSWLMKGVKNAKSRSIVKQSSVSQPTKERDQ